MTDFPAKLRHRCRNPHCRATLSAPVENESEAFCCRSCYSSFYLHRCLVCEGPIERKTGNQKVCRKASCRNALRGRFGLGGYHIPRNAKLIQKVPDFIDAKWPIKGDRPSPIERSERSNLIRNAKQTEFFGGGEWRTVVSPDGVLCHVTRLWGKDPQVECDRLAA